MANYLEKDTTCIEKIDIVDSSYLKEVTYSELLAHDNTIYVLKKIFFDMNENYNNYSLSNEEIRYLVTSGKLVIYDLTSGYSNVSEHDMIIYLANLLQLKNYIPTVYTNSENTALNLLLMNFEVRTLLKYDNLIDTSKVIKDQDADIVYFYDTCFFMEHFNEIDFSTNYHIFPLSVIEELLSGNNKEHKDNAYFFKFLWIYNRFKKNIEILFTESYIKKGNMYTYSDLIHLFHYINLVSSKKFCGKRIILMTKDSQLFYEAMSIKGIEVSPNFLRETSINLIETEDLSTDSTCAFDNEGEVAFEKSEEQEENISEKVKRVTENYTTIPYAPLYGSGKIISNTVLDGTLNNIKDNNFMNKRQTILSKKQKRYLGIKENEECYNIRVGFYISFIDNPKTFYLVDGFDINRKKIRLRKVQTKNGL